MEKLATFTRSKTAKQGGNNCSRDFHRWAHRDQSAFPVKISTLQVPIRARQKPGKGKKVLIHKKVDFPVIHLSSWFVQIMESCPEFFLVGCALDSPDWGPFFSNFWRCYTDVDPDHPVHKKSEYEKRHCLPMALHGDEGRGLAKVPLMVWSFQVICPFSGPNDLNTTQFLPFNLVHFLDMSPYAECNVPMFQTWCIATV